LMNERGGAKDSLVRPLLIAALDRSFSETAQRLALALRRAGIATRVLPATKRDKALKYSTAAGLPRLVLIDEEAAQRGVFELRTAGGEARRLSEADLISALR